MALASQAGGSVSSHPRGCSCPCQQPLSKQQHTPAGPLLCRFLMWLFMPPCVSSQESVVGTQELREARCGVERPTVWGRAGATWWCREGKFWRNPAGHGWEGRLSNFELINSTLPHPNYSKNFLGQRHFPATGATFCSGLKNQLRTALSAVTCKGFAVIWIRGYKDVCQRTNDRSS